MAVAARMDLAAWPPAGHKGPPYRYGSPAQGSTRVITAMSARRTDLALDRARPAT